MKSLSYLNGISANSIIVTDQRLARVVFDRVDPLIPIDQIITINSTTACPNPGINITEIINYSTANTRYRVKIVTGSANPLTGSSISWGTLPSGVTLSTSGNTYTLSGINSVATWNAIKNFTWTLPSNYATKPLWFLEVAVVYYDEASAKDIERNWLVYDPAHFYVAELSSTFSLNIDGANTRVILFSASLSSAVSVTATGKKLKIGSASLSSTFTLSATPEVNAVTVNATASTSLTAVGTVLFVNRSYKSNNSNKLFNIGYINDVDTSATFTISLTSSLGKFTDSDYSTPVTTYIYSGNQAQVNAIFPQILFFPTKGVSSNGTFTYTMKKNNITQTTQTVALNGISSSFTTQTITFVAEGLTYFQPTQTQLAYAKADILIVGGGGRGGGYYGGSGGGVTEVFNQTLTNKVYNVVVGAGGKPGVSQGGVEGRGANSSFDNSYVSGGGYAGGTVDGSGFPTTYYVTNSTGGPPNTGSGGAGAGSSPSGSTGGIGKLSTITGKYYAGGGSGADWNNIVKHGIPAADDSGGGSGSGEITYPESPKISPISVAIETNPDYIVGYYPDIPWYQDGSNLPRKFVVRDVNQTITPSANFFKVGQSLMMYEFSDRVIGQASSNNSVYSNDPVYLGLAVTITEVSSDRYRKPLSVSIDPGQSVYADLGDLHQAEYVYFQRWYGTVGDYIGTHRAVDATDGWPNTGGGGGGGGIQISLPGSNYYYTSSGNGGSGIVVIKFHS